MLPSVLLPFLSVKTILSPQIQLRYHLFFFSEIYLQQEQITLLYYVHTSLKYYCNLFLLFIYIFILLLNYEFLRAKTMFNSFRAPMYNTVCLKIQAHRKHLLNEQIFTFKTQFPSLIEVTFYNYFTPLCSIIWVLLSYFRGFWILALFLHQQLHQEISPKTENLMPYVITPILESFSLVSLPFLSLKSYTG